MYVVYKYGLRQDSTVVECEDIRYVVDSLLDDCFGELNATGIAMLWHPVYKNTMSRRKIGKYYYVDLPKIGIDAEILTKFTTELYS